jgi:hypothetical protein
MSTLETVGWQSLFGDIFPVTATAPEHQAAARLGPRVVAVNRFGREHILQQFRSRRSARRALPDFEAELDEMGVAAWRELHDFPPHFEIMQPPD